MGCATRTSPISHGELALSPSLPEAWLCPHGRLTPSLRVPQQLWDLEVLRLGFGKVGATLGIAGWERGSPKMCNSNCRNQRSQATPSASRVSLDIPVLCTMLNIISRTAQEI